MESAASTTRISLIPADLLRRIPGCADGRPPRQVVVLAGGGQLNRCLGVDTSEGRFVLRLRLDSNARPGASGQHELDSQRAAAAAGLAPSILDCAGNAAWVLMEFVPGRMWQRGDLADRLAVQALGNRLALLHTLLPPPTVPLLGVMQIASGQIEAIERREPAAGGELARIAAQAADLADLCNSLSRSPALNHGDLNVANLLGPSPMLVDWEYAQVADPLYDIACLLSYYPELQLRLDWLLGPSGLDEPRARRALEAYQLLFTLFNQLWARAQGGAHGDAAGLVPVRTAE